MQETFYFSAITMLVMFTLASLAAIVRIIQLMTQGLRRKRRREKQAWMREHIDRLKDIHYTLSNGTGGHKKAKQDLLRLIDDFEFNHLDR